MCQGSFETRDPRLLSDFQHNLTRPHVPDPRPRKAETLTTARPEYNVARGTAYITIQQVIVYLVYFLFYITIARVLTKPEVGAVSLLSAALAAFNALTLLALPQAATRYISSHLGTEERGLAGSVAKTTLRLGILIAVPASLVALPLSPRINSLLFPAGENYILELAFTFLIGSIIDLYLLYNAYFLGVGMYPEYAYVTILYVPLSRGVGVLFAIFGPRLFGISGVLGVIIGWAIGGIAALLLCVYYWHGRLPEPSNYPLRPLLAFTLPLFLATLITFGQQWGDIGVLQVRLGQLPTTGGYYIIANSVSFLSAFWYPVANALYPALSAAHATGDNEGVTSRLSITFRLTNLAVLPLGVAMAAIAPTLLIVAYGPSYATREEWIPFAILTITSMLTAQAAIYATTFQAVGRTRALLAVTLTVTILYLAWVWSLAPMLGTTAAATGRALLYSLAVYLSYRVLRPNIKTTPFKGFTDALALAIGTGLPLLATDQLFNLYAPARTLLRLPAFLVIFTGAFVAVSRRFQIFKQGDFALLKDVLPHRYQPFLRRIERLVLTRHSVEAKP